MDAIAKAFEAYTGQKACAVQKFAHPTNNSVYKVETVCGAYIFKVYAAKGWPEDGKRLFVNQKLKEYKIPHAEIVACGCGDETFPAGYLIEECLPGTTADRLQLSGHDALQFYKKLAALVSRVHQIKLTNYGYIGDGAPDFAWTTFSEFAYDCLGDYAVQLVEMNRIAADDFEMIAQEIRKQARICDAAPAVLNHGDLSLKNMLVHAGGITLIDWDDAHSLCWMDDIALLTLLMKWEYDSDTAETCRKAFLDSYETEHDKSLFYQSEDILHVRHGLEHLNFFDGKPQFAKINTVFQKSLKRCGIKAPARLL